MTPMQDTVEQQGDISAVLALFKYGQGTYGRLFWSIGLVVLSSGFLMFSAKFMGQLAESLVQKTPMTTITTLVSLILGLEILNVVVYYYGRIGIAFVTNKIAYQVRTALFRQISRLPITYFDRQPLGRTITRLTTDVEGIESFFSNTMPRILTAMITITSVFVAMLLTDFKIGLVVTLASMPAMLFTLALRKPVRHWLRLYKKRAAAINAKLAEYINGLGVIKIFGIETWTKRNFEQSSAELLEAGLRLMNWNSFIRPFAAFLCSIPIVVIIWWGGHLALADAISISLLVAFIRYAERYFRPIMQISFEIHLIQDAIASSERVRKMLEEPGEDETLGPNGSYQGTLQGKITFKDVWMEYQPGRPVLKSVSFNIPPGTSVGLVGRTGSGKSTTVHLLPLLYQKSKGQLLIDDIPIEAWDRNHLRSQIGIVSQDVLVFHGSLRDNLLAASEHDRLIPDEEILEACRRTGLNRVIDNMQDGLDTMILDGGSNLSMGERQLVSFTRMLIRDPKLLILDEATANIDEQCESLIQQAIVELLSNRTCFIIAHRLNTIRHCDRILVFEQGELLEDGSHDELVDRKSHYAHLIARQLQA
jgi:ABC-type multidrug transport system fused ATPase/permease subunit